MEDTGQGGEQFSLQYIEGDISVRSIEGNQGDMETPLEPVTRIQELEKEL